MIYLDSWVFGTSLPGYWMANSKLGDKETEKDESKLYLNIKGIE